jgi:predicted anti-sigma-YlaC factor YlaD
VTARARHLPEERLFDFYMAERAGEPVHPPVAEHLADCESCGARYADLAVFMDTLRSEGDAAADAVFGADRLRAQQQQIARRVALLGRPARVISFPGRIVRRTISASTSRTAPRWIAAAAAAGLFIGVAVGASYQSRWGGSPLRSRSAYLARDAASTRAARVAPMPARSIGPADVAADDAFLSDLEIALDRPHTLELQAFDAFTPHVREIVERR